jgi:hypothetical protein
MSLRDSSPWVRQAAAEALEEIKAAQASEDAK